MTALMEIPKCHIHNTQMFFRQSRTPEQAYCGAWYVCGEGGCQYTVLIPSPEIQAINRLAMQAKKGDPI